MDRVAQTRLFLFLCGRHRINTCASIRDRLFGARSLSCHETLIDSGDVEVRDLSVSGSCEAD
jgi:hypothetical protein